MKSRTGRNAIRALYRHDTLLKIQKSARKYPFTAEGDKKFAKDQQEFLQEIFSDFRYDLCMISTVKPDSNQIPIDMTSVLLDLPENILTNYMKVVHYDDLSPLVYLNPGRAVTFTHICSPHAKKNHPFYLKHHKKFGIESITSIGYLYPAHSATFITIDFMGSNRIQNWQKFDYSRLELATFPFVMCWFYRRSEMDYEELTRRFIALADLTEHQLQNLRKYINCSDKSLEEQAKELGIQPGTLKDDLYKTREIILSRFYDDSHHALGFQKRIPLRGLDQHVGFMRMLGDHTAPFTWPQGKKG